MAYSGNRIKVNSIQQIKKHLKNLLPVIFIFGEDTYAIEDTLKLIQKSAEIKIDSDFDKEIITAEKNHNLSQILDIASAFPFGAGKKFIAVKNFERVNDKKTLKNYLDDPPEFTFLVLINYGKISDLGKEPYKTLVSKNYIFEARELKGADLIDWIKEEALAKQMKLSSENANLLVDIVGPEKSLLEMQLEKFRNYFESGKEITGAEIEKFTASTKEYSIFDLQNALSENDKPRSLKIAYNLLSSGQEMPFIVAMLTRYVTTLAQINELNRQKLGDNEAAKKAGVSYYYYKNCNKPGFFRNHNKLVKAARVLYKADLQIKTTSADQKTLAAMLVSELLS